MVNPMLGDRYEVQQQLARKAGRRTLLARDLETQELVVVKLLSFDSDMEWDDFKLFKREAETLRTLSHPAIPRYLDFFNLDPTNSRGFALVQTYIQAMSLEQHLQAGRTFSEQEVEQLAKALLEILIYLHNRQPAVIHRDIKPSNILLGDRSGNSVGQVYLIDFGSVQNLAANKGGTMTVVGTYGYMPPEQFGNRAVPASDLYSLGATLIYLVTGTDPAALPHKHGRIQFEYEANINPDFANWLKCMTQPSLDRRLDSAKAALQSLKQKQNDATWLTVVWRNFTEALRRVAAFLTQCNNKFIVKVSRTWQKFSYPKCKVQIFRSRRNKLILCWIITVVLCVSAFDFTVINSIYEQVLNRDADGVEIARCSFDLAKGMTVDEMRSKIAHSKEAQIDINSTYYQVLHQEVESAELARYKSDLAKGMRFDEMRREIAHSEKAINNISLIYEKVLERKAKYVEIDRYISDLAKGMFFMDVRNEIVNSNSEDVKNKINKIYRQFYGHDVPSDELNMYIYHLANSTSLDVNNDIWEVFNYLAISFPFPGPDHKISKEAFLYCLNKRIKREEGTLIASWKEMCHPQREGTGSV